MLTVLALYATLSAPIWGYNREQGRNSPWLHRWYKLTVEDKQDLRTTISKKVSMETNKQKIK